MKILGALVLLWGLGLTFSAAFNYLTWLSLSAANVELSGSERAFVQDYGHGFFLFMTVLGILLAAGGVKLYRWHASAAQVEGQEKI